MRHRPRKRFGQHFLHDPEIIRRIVHSIAPAPGDRLVEIGPGEGAITLPLLQATGQLEAVELDRDVIEILEARAQGQGELVVHSADALRFDFAALAGDKPLRLVGNLPYNISTPLVFHVLTASPVIRDMHFMLQKEVVDRMVAPPGNRTYGRLSVMVAATCRAETLFDIGPGAFRPPPRVWSSFVRLVPHAEPPADIPDPAAFGRVVSTAFAQRRKTLRNALKGLLDAGAIQAAGCDPGARAETLDVASFAALARALGPPATGSEAGD